MRNRFKRMSQATISLLESEGQHEQAAAWRRIQEPLHLALKNTPRPEGMKSDVWMRNVMQNFATNQSAAAAK